MSDFVQTMKDWRRMCKAFTTDDDSCCYGCPVVDLREHGCGAIFEMEDGTDWERYEGQIREWAAEHPEPVYPCWVDWLTEQGIISDAYAVEHSTEPGVRAARFFVTIKGFEPIPADLAQKMGLQPKEG